MLCKVRKDTKNVDSKVLKTKKGAIMLLSKCALCGSKNWRMNKKQKDY